MDALELHRSIAGWLDTNGTALLGLPFLPVETFISYSDYDWDHSGERAFRLDL